MTAVLETSTAFASATASGTDWRDIGRKLLEALESARTERDDMNIGFLYVTAALAPDLSSLLSLLKNVSRVRDWYGAVGPGICGGGQSLSGIPAATAMLGHLPADSFRAFSTDEIPGALHKWMLTNAPVNVLMHCAPSRGHDLGATLANLREQENAFAFGCLTGGADHVITAPADGTCALALGCDIPVMSAASTGCIRAGREGIITRASGQTIETIDEQPAFVFLNEMIDELVRANPTAPKDPAGVMQAGFPIHGDDRGTLLLRDISGADEAAGTLNVVHGFSRGDRIQFVYRDNDVARSDLAHALTDLQARASRESSPANLKPKAILYFGSDARLTAGAEHDEAALIADVFPGVPLAGIYASAEICNGHIYGYTGVIVLLL